MAVRPNLLHRMDMLTVWANNSGELKMKDTAGLIAEIEQALDSIHQHDAPYMAVVLRRCLTALTAASEPIAGVEYRCAPCMYVGPVPCDHAAKPDDPDRPVAPVTAASGVCQCEVYQTCAKCRGTYRDLSTAASGGAQEQIEIAVTQINRRIAIYDAEKYGPDAPFASAVTHGRVAGLLEARGFLTDALSADPPREGEK